MCFCTHAQESTGSAPASPLPADSTLSKQQLASLAPPAASAPPTCCVWLSDLDGDATEAKISEALEQLGYPQKVGASRGGGVVMVGAPGQRE